MNEEIKTEALASINQLISYIQTGAKQAGDFVVEQTPLLVQEILTYNGIISGGLSLLGVVLFIVGVIVVFKSKWDEPRLTNIPFVILAVISQVVFWENIGTFLKITFAPRLYLIEYVSELIK